jgi:hypothetical protein
MKKEYRQHPNTKSEEGNGNCHEGKRVEIFRKVIEHFRHLFFFNDMILCFGKRDE